MLSSLLLMLGIVLMFASIFAFKLFTVWQISAVIGVIGIILFYLGRVIENERYKRKLRSKCGL